MMYNRPVFFFFFNLALIYNLKDTPCQWSSIDSRLLAIFLLFILSPIQCRLCRFFLHGCKVFTGQSNECLIRSCVKIASTLVREIINIEFLLLREKKITKGREEQTRGNIADFK